MGRDDNRDGNRADPPSYGRRWAAVLIPGLALVVALGWAFIVAGKSSSATAGNSRASRTPSVAASASSAASVLPAVQAQKTALGLASPAASPSAPDPGPGGSCPPGAVVVSLFSGRPSYPAGQDPRFEVYVVSTAPGTCTFDLGHGALHLAVMWAGRVIWDSADCARSDVTQVARLSRGVPVQESITWNRAITLPGCIELASSARPGTYEVQARTSADSSQVQTFKLR